MHEVSLSSTTTWLMNNGANSTHVHNIITLNSQLAVVLLWWSGQQRGKKKYSSGGTSISWLIADNTVDINVVYHDASLNRLYCCMLRDWKWWNWRLWNTYPIGVIWIHRRLMRFRRMIENDYHNSSPWQVQRFTTHQMQQRAVGYWNPDPRHQIRRNKLWPGSRFWQWFATILRQEYPLLK